MGKESFTKISSLYFAWGRIWSLWVGFWFLAYYLLLFPIYYFGLKRDSKKSLRLGHTLNRIWGKLILTMGLIRVKVVDRAKIDYQKKWIYVSNHRSYLDIPVCYVAMQQPFRFIGKAELGKLPLFGYMYRKLHILVARESKIARVRALVLAGQKLKEGDSLFIYPEGTTRHPENILLGEFQEGAFILAIQNKVDIVPITLINTTKAMSDDGNFLIFPMVTVKVIIGSPISVADLALEEVENVKNKCYQIIYDNLMQNHGN